MPSQLSQVWDDLIGPPMVAHDLRTYLPNRWVRFHALPESKRYPSNEAEYVEILRRHNLLLTELGASGANIFVIVPEHSATPDGEAPSLHFRQVVPPTKPWVSLRTEEPEPWFLHLHAAQLRYERGALDPLLRLIADDVLYGVIIVIPKTGVVLHPYDGGIDVILRSTAERDRVGASHTAWLPFDLL